MPEEVQQFICSDPYELLSQAMEILRVSQEGRIDD